MVIDYKHYKETYHLTNQAFIEYDLKKIEFLEKKFLVWQMKKD